jgi:hypothetical protein
MTHAMLCNEKIEYMRSIMKYKYLLLVIFFIGAFKLVFGLCISQQGVKKVGISVCGNEQGYTIENDGFAPITISYDHIKKIAEKIWHNECRGTIAGLTSWNEGEDFASLGIGHFIWYPQDKKGVFKDTFPSLLSFLENQGKKIPSGILKKGSSACPWNSRAEFLKESSSKKMLTLRNFLADTVDLQAIFMVQRLVKALPLMLQKLPFQKQTHIKKQFYRIARSPGGLYALIDYVNFKGEGMVAHEQYKGHRWGLLQVLEKTKGVALGRAALQDFAKAAKDVLVERVAHASHDVREKEEKWLKGGWGDRLKTYMNEYLE